MTEQLEEGACATPLKPKSGDDPNEPPFAAEDILTVYIHAQKLLHAAAEHGHTPVRFRQLDEQDGSILWRAWQRMYRVATPAVRARLDRLCMLSPDHPAEIMRGEYLPYYCPRPELRKERTD